jgi:hypothetical protein
MRTTVIDTENFMLKRWRPGWLYLIVESGRMVAAKL